MQKIRSELGNSLFKLAKRIYPAGKNGNPVLKEIGDMLFKLAAKVSPNK